MQVAGYWTSHEEMATALTQASRRAGEKVWRMPLEEAYWELVRTPAPVWQPTRQSCSACCHNVCLHQIAFRHAGLLASTLARQVSRVQTCMAGGAPPWHTLPDMKLDCSTAGRDRAELALSSGKRDQSKGYCGSFQPVSSVVQMKSPIADMKNTGVRYGGAITAALFLRQFVDTDKARTTRPSWHRPFLLSSRLPLHASAPSVLRCAGVRLKPASKGHFAWACWGC